MRRAVAVLCAIASAACGGGERRSSDGAASDGAASGAGDVLAVPACFAVRGRWPDPSRIRVGLELATSPLPAAAFTAAVQQAMQAWNASGVVGFVFATDGEAVDLTLGFRRGRHGACAPFGPNADVAHAGLQPQPFVHFDLERDWREAGAQGLSLSATALHELGHVLGLGHVDADDAVMGSAMARPQQLTWHDLSGLHSLYGGGVASAGDLQLVNDDGGVVVTLRAVAPPRCSAFSCFDGDGDGRDEVLVWRTDPAGHGALMLYQFDAEARLVRTLGPFHGAVVPGARVGFVVAPDGRRCLVVHAVGPDGGVDIVRQFDGFGAPVVLSAPIAAAVTAQAAVRLRADFDGDGVAECGLRRAP